MLTCPNDLTRLRPAKVAGGVAFVCDTCGGRAVMLPLLRRQLEPEVAKQLWARAVRSATLVVPCPACRATSARLDLDVAGESVELDVCRACTCVWFDRGEREQLPDAKPARPPDDGLPPEVRQGLAIAQVQRMAARAREEDAELPSLTLSRLPAILGMPVELAESDSSARPWLTWGTAALVAVVSIAGFRWPWIVEALQMVPSRLGESAGLTTLTAFFVHGSWMHLLGNLWFLVVFGDNVEQILGRAQWLVVVVGATFLGAVAQVAIDPRGDMPCVGASGGISGLIVCYVLSLPNARLGVFLWIWFRPMWVTFSARTGFLVWLAMQALLLWKQLAGLGDVSALAHLGGVAAGVLVWSATHHREAP